MNRHFYNSPRLRTGLVLCELVAVGVVLAMLVLALLVAGSRQRRVMGLGQSESNLRELAAAHASYGNDNAGLVATFTWNAQTFGSSAFSDLNGPFAEDTYAATCQSVDIMRRSAGGNAGNMPVLGSRTVFVNYGHLVLCDYMGVDARAPWAVSPGDAPRLQWRADGGGPNPSDTVNYRWAFSSSYEMPIAFWCNDFGNSSGTIPTLIQNDHYTAFISSGSLVGVTGKRRYDQVSFPSSKVLLFEQFQRFFGPRDVFGLYPEARVPSLLADGSVQTRATKESNQGQNPRYPTQRLTRTMITYSNTSTAWDPPARYGSGYDIIFGAFRWTRYGLRGRDFDGPETTTPP